MTERIRAHTIDRRRRRRRFQWVRFDVVCVCVRVIRLNRTAKPLKHKHARDSADTHSSESAHMQSVHRNVLHIYKPQIDIIVIPQSFVDYYCQ